MEKIIIPIILVNVEITIIQTIIFWVWKHDVFIQQVSPKKQFVTENLEIRWHSRTYTQTPHLRSSSPRALTLTCTPIRGYVSAWTEPVDLALSLGGPQETSTRRPCPPCVSRASQEVWDIDQQAACPPTKAGFEKHCFLKWNWNNKWVEVDKRSALWHDGSTLHLVSPGAFQVLLVQCVNSILDILHTTLTYYAVY